MSVPVKNSIAVPAVPGTWARGDPSLTEPFGTGRQPGRLLFDFGVMASLLKPDAADAPLLDFGAGSGWISELCARMGLHTVSFDVHGDLASCLAARAAADRRVDPALLGYAHGDGHAMPFEAASFGHLLCYDTLHHMHDYPRVFAEFHRVLRPGGRAIFVEPGAGHSSSRETIAFVEAQKQHDPNWIERDVVLEDIDQIARAAGFADGVRIVPVPHPQQLMSYTLTGWTRFRKRRWFSRRPYTDQLARINYWDRIVFCVDKPA
jgi:SAM-dependent methyltransferase